MTTHPTFGDLEVVARTVWGEARGEGFDGKLAVANVICNRVALQGWMGHTYAEVCLKQWQFSCWNANDPNRALVEVVDLSEITLRECVEAGLMAFGIGKDPSRGSTHYCRNDLNPHWAVGHEPAVVFGNHSFYNDIVTEGERT